MKRAYALLNVKAIVERDDEYVIEGIASTPRPDRMKDIVDPMGARFSVPMPLLWQHKSDKPVGRVEWAKPTKDGIPYRAHLPKVKEAGTLRERIEEAVQSMKYRLVGAVSIGFDAIEGKVELLKTGGLKFLEWEWLELSLVTIPANPDATITSLKSMDEDARAAFLADIKATTEQQRAALGPPGGDPPHSPGASGHQSRPPTGGLFHSRSLKGNTVKTISQLREERMTKAARLQELTTLWQGADHVKTAEERAEFDTLDAEIGDLDDEIRVLRVAEIQSAGARPVAGETRGAGAGSRGPTIIVRKQDPDDAFKGQSYTRMLIAKALSFMAMKEGNVVSPVDIARHRWGKSHPKLVDVIRTAVAGGGTGSGEWGAELVESQTRFNGDFVEYLYSMTVFDRLPLRPMPARVHIKGQDGAATGYWVGESKAIPVSKADFSDVELTPLKVAALAVCSKELIADSSPSAEMWIRDSIAQASAQRVDTTFLSTSAASSGVSPAGILNGLSAAAPSGTDAAAVRADLMTLYTGFLTAKNASGLVQVMTPSMAKALALLVNALGQPEFVGLNANGGTLLGDPVYTGDNVTGGHWILLKPSDIWKIGDSGLEVSMSDQATIEQNDTPAGAGDTPTAASATLMSLWQTEQVGFKVVRRINYKLRRSGAVAYLDNAEYGGVVS